MLATFMAYAKDAAMPMRRPGWEQQGYWGRPVVQSKVRPVADSATWQTIEEVRTPDEYATHIQEFIATPLNLPYPAGLSFRVRCDGRVFSGIQLAAGVDRNHLDTFPLARQHCSVVFISDEVFALDVLNQTGGSVDVASGVYGWHYYSPSGERAAPQESQVDVPGLADLGLTMHERSLDLFDE